MFCPAAYMYADMCGPVCVLRGGNCLPPRELLLLVAVEVVDVTARMICEAFSHRCLVAAGCCTMIYKQR